GRNCFEQSAAFFRIGRLFVVERCIYRFFPRKFSSFERNGGNDGISAIYLWQSWCTYGGGSVASKFGNGSRRRRKERRWRGVASRSRRCSGGVGPSRGREKPPADSDDGEQHEDGGFAYAHLGIRTCVRR